MRRTFELAGAGLAGVDGHERRDVRQSTFAKSRCARKGGAPGC